MAAKDDLVFRARLAEQAERFEDMVKNMREVASLDGDLSVEERNLLSVAYKNVVGAKRASWRVISSIKAKIEKNQDSNVYLEKEFLEIIEKELKDICNQVIELLDTYLIKIGNGEKLESDKADSQVFYLKMKGDYYRYLAEIEHQNPKLAEYAEEAYKNAATAAEVLASTHPIKLGLALNYSVFHYEIMNKAQKACDLAKKAFDDAIAELDDLKDETYKDSTLIMQLLRDNLTLWTAEGDAEGDDGTQVEDIEAGGE